MVLGCFFQNIRYYRYYKKTLARLSKKNMKSKFPKGWDEKRVRKILAHYEKQTEEEAVPEDEAAFKKRTMTAMEAT